MRIDQTFRMQQAAIEKSKTERRSAENASQASEPPRGKLSISGDTASLVKQLRELPDDSAQRVSDVKQRLAQGDLMTREGAEKTAAAMLSLLAGR